MFERNSAGGKTVRQPRERVQDAPRISERLRRNASFWERQPSGALEIWNVVLHRQHRHDRKFSIRKFILKP
jgi:hypothetical protein